MLWLQSYPSEASPLLHSLSIRPGQRTYNTQYYFAMQTKRLGKPPGLAVWVQRLLTCPCAFRPKAPSCCYRPLGAHLLPFPGEKKLWQKRTFPRFGPCHRARLFSSLHFSWRSSLSGSWSKTRHAWRLLGTGIMQCISTEKATSLLLLGARQRTSKGNAAQPHRRLLCFRSGRP